MFREHRSGNSETFFIGAPKVVDIFRVTR